MSLRPMDSDLKRFMSPSLSLVMVASFTPKPHNVYIEDENIKNINFNDNPDIVGINVNVDTFKRAAEIAKIYRQRNIKVVFGGIHASANPDDMLNYCDSVLIGEANLTWEKLLDDFIHNNLKSKYANIEPINHYSLPIPNWDKIQKDKYLYYNIITTSRGCPFKCEFCYNSSKYVKSKYRNRPHNEVIQEIKAMPNKQVMIIDDNFIGNPKWTLEFIRLIKPMNLTWHAAVSTDLLKHKYLIKAFAESGCKSLFIGFESINQNSIKSVNKSQNRIEEYEELIHLLHENGIMVNASLVFGFDHDTKEVFKDTVSWLIKNKVESMTAHILTPYPGTKLFEKLLHENRIFDTNTNNYNTANVVYTPMKMSAKELKEGYLWAYKEFYSFKNIFKRLPDRKDMHIPYYLFNFGYRKFGKLSAFFGKLFIMSFISKLSRKLSYNIG